MYDGKKASALAEVILEAIGTCEVDATYTEIFAALDKVKCRITDRLCEHTSLADMKFK